MIAKFSLPAFLILLALPAAAPGQPAQVQRIGDELAALVEGALHLDGRMAAAAADRLYDACVIEHGSMDPVLSHLQDEHRIEQGLRISARRLRAFLLWRVGDLAEAVKAIETIAKPPEAERDDVLAYARLLDALGRDAEAAAAYDRVLSSGPEDRLRAKILLRQALLSPSTGEDSSPLFTFAQSLPEGDPLRNQAAIILGLTDRQREAIDLYVLEGEESARFQAAIRLAEWALEAGEHGRAEVFAREAAQAAKLKRDRRYGLTVLAEAARRAGTLDELIDRLAGEADLQTEHRDLLIDLLRETGRAREALDLFHNSAPGRFTADMRRELLDMCRDLEDDEVLVATYRELIAAEPRFIEWREGLARFHLERGDRDAAIAVWKDYPQATRDFRYLLAAAASLKSSGLDELSLEIALDPGLDPDQRAQALLFAFELHFDRGDFESARKRLDQLDGLVPADARIRSDISDAWARLGDREQATGILLRLRDAMGDTTGSDLEMKLAVLLSEVGKEEEALEMWTDLWRRTTSVPRRRYVEDRIMTVASRLGRLAHIAVDLERRLAEGRASDLESGLLVRIYTKVNDSVSAAEVIQEHLRNSNRREVDALNEKARVYLACNDFFHYEKTVRELIDADPDNSPDYLRQLAMSSLERGQRKEAKEILSTLKDQEASAFSDEFEAGILALAGLRNEAEQAYRKGLVRSPERIDGYLLLSNVQRELNQHDRSAGMFQHLAETADKDDLFTIAIDGLLNMRDGRANQGVPDRLIRWARRITLERIADAPDRFYLYQLLSDLSDELRDRAGAIRALAAAMPIASEQRTPLLRELMDLSKGRGGDRDRRMFGRRLIGQGDLVPPQVYLDLGSSFLAAGDVLSASRTFREAQRLPEFPEMLPGIAAEFMKANFPREALRIYETIMSTSMPGPAILLTVAELHEQLGSNAIARDIYSRVIHQLLAARPLTTDEKRDGDGSDSRQAAYYFGRNTDEFSQHIGDLVTGLLATFEDDAGGRAWIRREIETVEAELAAVRSSAGDRMPPNIEQTPRIRDRANVCRRIAFALSDTESAERLDLALLQAFPGDAALIGEALGARRQWGYLSAARRLIDALGRDHAAVHQARAMLGDLDPTATGRLIHPGEAARLLLPYITRDDREGIRDLLVRTDPARASSESAPAFLTLADTASYIGEPDLCLTFLRQYVSQGLKGRDNPYQLVTVILNRSRKLLDAERRKSLITGLVEAIIQQPDKANAIISRLQDLKKEAGEDLLAIEHVEAMIRNRLDAGEDRGVYQIAPLIAAAPPGDRWRLLRECISRVGKGRHLYLLFQTMPSMETPLGETAAETLVATLEAAIAETKDDWQFSQMENLASTPEANLPVALRMTETILKLRPSARKAGATHAMVLNKMGRSEDALTKALDAYSALLPLLPGGDYYVNQEINLLRSMFPAETRAFLLVLSHVESQTGRNVALLQERIHLLSQSRDGADPVPAILEAIRENPSEESFKDLYLRHLRARGDTPAAIAFQAERVAAQPKDRGVRIALADLYASARNFVRASQALQPLIDQSAAAPPDPEIAAAPTRMPPASMELVKREWEAGRYEEATHHFRRVWRRFPPPRDGTRRFAFRLLNRILWPAEQRTRTASLPRGGMPPLDPPAASEPDGEGEPAADAPEPRLAADVLGERPEGLAELRAWLRTIDADGLDKEAAVDLSLAILRAVHGESGVDGAEAAMLDAIKTGRAGKLHFATLFRLLEEHPERKSQDIALVIDELLTSLHPEDTAPIRRLARLYSAFGETDKAARLYRWCAEDGDTRRSGIRSAIHIAGGGFATASTVQGSRSLLEEIAQIFSGQTRIDLVSAILEGSDPGPDSWNRDWHGATVLATWSRFLAGDELRERIRPVLDWLDDPESSIAPLRQTAAQAVAILAELGDVERALRALEVAVCSIPAPERRQPWYRDQFTTPPRLAFTQGRLLFPKAAPDTPQARYLESALARICHWSDEGRIDSAAAFNLFVFLAGRLHDAESAGSRDLAIERVRTAAGNQPVQRLWLADILARCGATGESEAIVLGLLKEGGLPLGRIPEALPALARTEGSEAALSIADGLLEWCGQPAILDAAAELHRQAGNEGEAARIEALKREHAAAEASTRRALADLRRNH